MPELQRAVEEALEPPVEPDSGDACTSKVPRSSSDGTAPDNTEPDLLTAALNGDVKAFGELTQRHRATCMRRAMLMIRNRSDAEDEVQNAFSKAFQRLGQFRGEGSFEAWLNRIVENQCLMKIREDRNSRFVYLDEPTESDVKVELVGQTADPEDQLGNQEVVRLLHREVSHIPPLLRSVMLLRDLDQLAMPDVAQRLGLSIPAAKSRLMRARTELRSRINKHCGRKGLGSLIHMSRYAKSAYTRAS